VEIVLDGAALMVTEPTLAAALRHAADEAQRRGRVIIEVKADGARLSDEVLSNPGAGLEGVRTLAFISADPAQLVSQSLRDCAAALDEAAAEQRRASDLIQSGRTSEALEVVARVLGTWQAVSGVVDHSAALLGRPLGDVGELGEATADLRTHLRSMKDAMGAEDWPALSDVLGYDLDAQATRWRTLVESMADDVERGAKST